jgi:ABC-type molybdate transport system ATPase subunit
MRKLLRVQMDLFVTPVRPAELIGVERQKAVALLRALLTEAVMTLAGEPSTSGKKEAGNE